MKPHIVKFFQFLEDKEGKNAPLTLKLLNQDGFNFTKDELNVKGGLNLSFSKITTLPDGLKVVGNVYLTKCTLLTLLPNDFQVIDGWLDLRFTSIRSLPNNLKVDMGLSLEDTPLAEMYSVDEIRAMIESKGGYVGGDIYV